MYCNPFSFFQLFIQIHIYIQSLHRELTPLVSYISFFFVSLYIDRLYGYFFSCSMCFFVVVCVVRAMVCACWADAPNPSDSFCACTKNDFDTRCYAHAIFSECPLKMLVFLILQATADEKEARRKSISFFLENKKQFIYTKNVEKQIDHKQQKQKNI